MEKVIVTVDLSKGHLENTYKLYDTGIVIREYDKHIYPGGQSLIEEIDGNLLEEHVKVHLLNAAAEDDKELVKVLLGMQWRLLTV